MMYFDRRLPDPLLNLLTGHLAWLVDLVHSRWGADHLAHLQFRRANGDRRRGGIQLYLGRTSPLEIVGRAHDCVEFVADKAYRAVSPTLLGGHIPVSELAALQEPMQAHLRSCAEMASRSFLTGEALSHAGMMRRYGMAHRSDDPMLVVDSEVRVGFGSLPERNSFEAELAETVKPGKAGLPRKLDAIGILQDGAIALIEVKEERGDMARAVTQVVAHQISMSRLIKQSDGELSEVLNGIVASKVAVGLIPENNTWSAQPSRLVPIIAAPDDRSDWADAWLRDTKSLRETHRTILDELRLWRLSESGEVLEERLP